MSRETANVCKVGGSLLTIVVMYVVVKNSAPSFLPVWFLALGLTAASGWYHATRNGRA